MLIIGAGERASERVTAKALLVGYPGVGKTSLLRTLDPARTLFVDVEAGDLAVRDFPVALTVRPTSWQDARDIACAIGGPDPSFPPGQPYSQAHYDAVAAAIPGLDQVETVFVDSLTALSRLCLRYAEQQPEAVSDRTGAKNLLAAYGLNARETILLLQRLQHSGRNIILVAILERILDEFRTPHLQIQLEGSRAGRELLGIVDEVVTLDFINFGDGKPVRALVCTSPNVWGVPAKDRSGRLDQIEEPHLGRLIKKITRTERREPT